MMTKIKFFTLIAFFTVTGICSAQTFSVAEITSLVTLNADDFKQNVTEKGYTNENIVTGNGAMTQDYEYSNNSGSSISLICPTFGTDTKMVSWEFKSPAVYDGLKDELVRNGYRLNNTERRNGGKYIALYYSRGGSDIILSSDTRVYPYGLYIISAMYKEPVRRVKKKLN